MLIIHGFSVPFRFMSKFVLFNNELFMAFAAREGHNQFAITLFHLWSGCCHIMCNELVHNPLLGMVANRNCKHFLIHTVLNERKYQTRKAKLKMQKVWKLEIDRSWEINLTEDELKISTKPPTQQERLMIRRPCNMRDNFIIPYFVFSLLPVNCSSAPAVLLNTSKN